MLFLRIVILSLSLWTQAAPTTLLLKIGNGPDKRRTADCQWVESDLNESLTPDMVNVGFGTVLKINGDLRIKKSENGAKAVWQKTDFLPAYKENGYLIGRFTSLEQQHGKRGMFYETAESIEQMMTGGFGFALRPGDLIVSEGDPALLRYLFAAPVVEFTVLKREIEDGVVVYRPTQQRGAIAMETISKSATTVLRTHYLTITGERQQRKLAKAACESKLKM